MSQNNNTLFGIELNIHIGKHKDKKYVLCYFWVLMELICDIQVMLEIDMDIHNWTNYYVLRIYNKRFYTVLEV